MSITTHLEIHAIMGYISTVRSLLGILACAGLVGCGVHNAGGTSSPSTSPAPARAVDLREAEHRDVDLKVAQLVADPHGPTTAETISLHIVFANLGSGFTPYGYVQGTLSYLPIRFTVTRDGETMAHGEVDGMTGHDSVARDIVVHDATAGDRTYVVTIDSGGEVDESDETNNSAIVTVVYGGSG
jgi:hypothetical protein